jgi:hypothetical protein
MEIRQEMLRPQMQRQHEIDRFVTALCGRIVSNPDEEPALSTSSELRDRQIGDRRIETQGKTMSVKPGKRERLGAQSGVTAVALKPIHHPSSQQS